MEQKRKKSYYSNNYNAQKRRKQLSLEVGMTGFLCTCNFHEKDCVRDAYKLLNEFADELYGSNKLSNDSTRKDNVEDRNESVSSSKQNSSDDEDISTALSKEINQLKAESEVPIALRRFQVVNTGVKNVVFIKSTLTNPLDLVLHIIKELDKSKKQRSRYLLRLLPIEAVCKAYINDIKNKANIIFEKYFAQEPKTYSIIFNHRSNNNIKREDIIEDLAYIITKKNPGNKANLKNPEIAVVIEVIRGICLISVAPDYYKYKRYNLLEICNIKEEMKNNKDRSIAEPKHLDKDYESSKNVSDMQKLTENECLNNDLEDNS